MYEFILTERLSTVLATILLALLTSSLVGAGRLWLRGLIYNLAPAMAAAFYAVAFLAQPRPDVVDLIAGLLFEITLLALFFRIFLKLKNHAIVICVEDSIRVLKLAVVLQLLVAYPNMTMDGFGLFSEGSRIDYISASTLAKYYTYAGLLISTVQAVFLASLVTGRGYIGILGWFVIVVNLALSVLAGSKGGAFLWLLSIASLIEYRRARIQTYKLIMLPLIGIGAVLISSLIVADFFNLELGDFINLAMSRFFLNNDARALALDLRATETADFSFFSEAFRSLGNLLGYPPRNDPLGVVLYREGLDIANGNGGNTSFMALATYYFPTGYVFVPALLGMLGAIFFVGLAGMSARLFHKATHRAMATSISLACLLTYSQDFLAFQVLLPLAVLTIFAIWISQSKIYGVNLKLQHGKN
jgi:hypothetical protein